MPVPTDLPNDRLVGGLAGLTAIGPHDLHRPVCRTTRETPRQNALHGARFARNRTPRFRSLRLSRVPDLTNVVHHPNPLPNIIIIAR